MSGRRRVHVSWLLLVAFTSMGLGVCVTMLSASAGMACHAHLEDGQAAFTCCSVDEQSSAAVPAAVYAAAPAAEGASVAPPRVTAPPSGRHLLRRVPFRAADPQALLSIFLI
jgi:hypothetical protein